MFALKLPIYSRWTDSLAGARNLQSFLPSCAIREAVRHHDDTRAATYCAHLQQVDIDLFDTTYVNFTHRYELCQRGASG